MRRKIPPVVLAFLCLVGAFTSCEDFMISIYGYSRLSGTDQLEGVGTVVYISIGGGFYGIIAGKDGHWEPINLPAGYMKDGLRVRFQAKLRNDLSGTHMWGILVELTSISKI